LPLLGALLLAVGARIKSAADLARLAEERIAALGPKSGSSHGSRSGGGAGGSRGSRGSGGILDRRAGRASHAFEADAAVVVDAAAERLVGRADHVAALVGIGRGSSADGGSESEGDGGGLDD